MLRVVLAVGSSLLALAVAGPSSAGEKEDWADCIAGDRTGSVAACTRIITRGKLSQGDLAIAHYNRGRAHRWNDDNGRALADYDTALRLNPRHVNSFYNRGLVHRDRGAVDQAIGDFTSYIALKSDAWEAYYHRARLWRTKGNPDRALADLESAAKLNPTAQNIILMTGLARADKGDNEGALAEFNKVIAANPGNAEAYYLRADVYFRTRQLGDATADVERALAIESGFTAAHTLMGRILEARGDPDRARTHYQRALASPAKLVDSGSAQNTARERVASLTGQTIPEPVPQPSTRKLDCRRFIPTAGTTISIECD